MALNKDYSKKEIETISIFENEYDHLSPEEIGMVLSLEDNEIQDFLLGM